jgi:hypothetical protein
MHKIRKTDWTSVVCQNSPLFRRVNEYQKKITNRDFLLG